VISIEVLPDAATETLAREAWQRLVDAGLPSAARHTGASNRPHITLAVRDNPALEGLGEVVHLLPQRLRLGGVLLFPWRSHAVVSWQVVMTADLAALHRRVAELVGPSEERYATSAPDAWSPHLTMARRVALSDLGAAVEVLDLHPHEGSIEGLRIWNAETRTVTTLR
jgi:2'-5' RNA ligase